MDGRNFDDLTKKLAQGASRRSLLKALLGGAGAAAATTVLKNGADATHCDEGAVQVDCPAGLAGEAPEGSQGGLAGVCCTGIGTCCSRQCIDFGASHEGACAPHSSEVTTTTTAAPTTTTAAPTTTTAAPDCQDVGESCESHEDCCIGLICHDDICVVCIPEKGFCEWDEDCCKGLACFDNVCEFPKQVCVGKDEVCKVDHDCCHGLRCADGKCRRKVDKPVDKPDVPVTVDTLPSTGVSDGPGNSGGILGMTLAGGAAALFAAKVLRRKPAEDTTEA